MTTPMYEPGQRVALNERFRGYLPVVVDVETGGLDEQVNPLLEIAVVTVGMDEEGQLFPDVEKSTHVTAFEGAEFNQKSLELNGIDPDNPLRAARSEREALSYVFQPIRQAVRDAECTRAILVGHNAAFDLKFLNAAVDRSGIKRNPFHPFSCFDTVTLAGLAFGQTVLARAFNGKTCTNGHKQRAKKSPEAPGFFLFLSAQLVTLQPPRPPSIAIRHFRPIP